MVNRILGGLLASLLASSCLAQSVTNIGSITASSGATTTVVTLSGSCSAGKVAFVAAAVLAAFPTISSVGDSQSNSYTLGNQVDGNSHHAGSAFSVLTTGLVATNTVTVTWANANGTRMAEVDCLTGPFTASPNDINPTSDGTPATGGSSTTPTVTSAALAQASELFLGFTVSQGSATVTEASGFTNVDSLHDGTSNATLNIGWKQTAATTAVTYNPTLSASEFWSAHEMSFKLSGAAPVVHELMLLGVGQ